MKSLDAAAFGSLVEQLCLEVSHTLPLDVSKALEDARGKEKSPLGREVIEMILENASEAERLGVPLCQDTGSFAIYLGVGDDVCVTNEILPKAGEAVSRATERGHLRASIVSPPVEGRVNTKNNNPPALYVELLPGEKSFLAVLAKGGGSEMSSRATMLPPGAGWIGIRKFAVGVVDELGPYSCPPLVVGIGIGGGFDRAPFLAKKALLLPLDEPNPDGELSKQERKITEEINTLGIGPAAFGGTITCLGTKIMQAPCHMATLPIAVCLSCHSLRRKIVEI